jgi:hypothetical protein
MAKNPTTVIPPSNVSLWHTVEAVKEGLLGINHNWVPGPTTYTDDHLGTRLNQPRAVKSIRLPTLEMTCRFVSNGAGRVVRHDIHPIKNITTIYFTKAHISGMAAPQDNLHLKFFGSHDREALTPHSSLHIGLPQTKNEGVIVEGDPVETDLILNACAPPILYAQHRQPRELSSISLDVRNLDGDVVLYDELVAWFTVEVEFWQ